MPVENPYTWYDLGKLEWINTGTYTTSGITTGYYDWPTNTTSWTTPATITFNNVSASSSTLGLWRGDWTETLVEGERPVRDDGEALRRVARSEARSAQRETERETSRQLRAQAVARGEELLLSLLDTAQIASYRLDGHFEVIGSHGTLYRVHRGTSGNIEWVKPDGSVGGRLCAHPTMAHDWLPTEDVMLAQLLALQHNEREFVRVANVHAGTRPPMREVAQARWDQSVVA